MDADNNIDEQEDNFTMEDFGVVSPKIIQNLILRPTENSLTGLAVPDFQGCPEMLPFVRDLPILIVGAGGLGCELLKNLALLGFCKLSVIDMDTIDLSNLNRQFLFRQKDIGKSKAECAAKFITGRIPQCDVQAYCNRIEDFDDTFYRQFRIVVCGLDSVVARRWMNGMLLSLIQYDDQGSIDMENSTIIPLIDGGTEGFKGNVRVVTPGMSACLECTVDLYPPAVNFPMCTIAHTPRLPEHCVEYAKVLLWPKEEPFGANVSVDGDDPDHINWIWKKAEERAKEFNIQGVTYRLTLGVVKHIIPAVASTNAIVASICATEVLKIASSMYAPLNNFLSFNDTDGIYTNSFSLERNENCLACSQRPQVIHVRWTDTLRSFIDTLKENPRYQMRNPGVTAMIDGKQRTLFIGMGPLLEQTRGNLSKSFRELDIKDGQEISVVDVTSPAGKVFILKSQPN